MEQRQPPQQSRWTDIDHQADPESFKNYLDTATALDSIQEYKRKSYDMLRATKGHRILDVGCGTGDDVLVLAQIVGSTGEVVGVDNSEALILEARKRVVGKRLPVEFRVADVHRLDFPDNAFDGCRADRVFQHLSDREQALAEMVRVARPGSQIVVLDPDWETMAIDSPNKVLTRKILNFRCDGLRNGWCGRQLFALYKKAGLADIVVTPTTIFLTDFGMADKLWGLRLGAEGVQKKGEITPSESTEWIEQLVSAGQAGLFFFAITGFGVSGRKP